MYGYCCCCYCHRRMFYEATLAALMLAALATFFTYSIQISSLDVPER